MTFCKIYYIDKVLESFKLDKSVINVNIYFASPLTKRVLNA